MAAAQRTMGIGRDDGWGNRSDMHVRRAKLGVLFENKDKSFGHVEGAVRDCIMDLEAGEVVVCNTHVYGQDAGLKRCPAMYRAASGMRKATAGQHEQDRQR